MKLGFLVDLNLCMGCKGCEVACKVENQVPLHSWRLRVKYVDVGVYPETKRTYTPLRCNHCEDAPCERICPVSALHYLENGIVNIDKERCIGCAGCMMACPYGAIYMDPVTNTADKCTFCAHRVASSMMPACVVACPVEANIFGDLDDPASQISQYIMRHQKEGGVQVRKPEKNTHPKHFYVGGGQVHLNPLASKREEGYNLFNKITHLDHIGGH
ncbi:MAG: 4Fe-4S dicluster domain-containing protein [Epsilonproteobacteria bacterium]|nr:4Fe-4S ferredoxin [Campylobacterota bacterium]NPA56840.1 4Fe-4S dicluster domain-containing protein [Campylobacterota bacterium]